MLIVNDGQILCAHSSLNGNKLWCTPDPTLTPAATNTSVSTGSFLVGPDRLYVAYILEQVTPLSPTEIATRCGQDPSCAYKTKDGMFNHVHSSIQVKALNYQNGQVQWTSKPIAYTGSDPLSVSASLALVQLQQNTLLVGSGSPLLTGLDANNGHMLWQTHNSLQQREILQIIGTA